MFLVPADHIHLNHRHGAFNWKYGMIGIVLASDFTLFFAGKSAEKNTAGGGLGPVSKRAGKSYNTGRSRSVVICARPDLAVIFAIMIVVRTDHHDLLAQTGITALDQSKNILGCEANALDIQLERGALTEVQILGL